MPSSSVNSASEMLGLGEHPCGPVLWFVGCGMLEGNVDWPKLALLVTFSEVEDTNWKQLNCFVVAGHSLNLL